MSENTKKLLSLLMAVAMVVTMMPISVTAQGQETEPTPELTLESAADTSAAGSATISFADAVNRTEQTTDTQVWVQNGITVTNEKAASNSNVANYVNPVRFYQGSKLTIEAAGMTKILVSCNSAKPVSGLTNALANMTGITVTADGYAVTIELDTATDSFVIEELAGQIRVDEITVFFGSTTETSDTTLELGVQKNVVITEMYAEVTFSFTPAESGAYRFRSIADHETLGYLYDSDMNHMVTGYGYSDQGNGFEIFRNLEAGATYYLTARYWNDDIGTFQVVIEQSPLQSITFMPITVSEGTCGYMTTEWNPDTGNYDLEYYYYQPGELLRTSTYTATFTDGTVITGTDTWFTYQGEYYSMSYKTEQSYDHQWTAGNTYYINVSIMGQNVQVPVTITASPLQSITFTPVSVFESTCGHMTLERNPETGAYDLEYFIYEPWNLLEKSTYTATFTDGTVLTGTGTSFDYQGESYSMSYETEQSYENQWTVGNTYYINVSIMGQNVQVPVTITAPPLQSITFTPVSVVESTCGNLWTEWNPETGSYDREFYHYQPWDLLEKSTYTATFTDGTVLTGTGTSFDYQGENYGMSYEADQSYENPWTVGNTYYINVSIMGQSVQVPVTITASPLQSLTFAPVSVVVGTCGNVDTDWNPETGYNDLEYFRYEPWDLLQKSTYTAAFTDGTVLTGTGTGFTYNGEHYSMSYETEQSYENQWTVGNTYYIDVSIMGQSVQVPVTIISSPLQSLTFTPVSVIAGTCGNMRTDWNPETGSYDLEYFYYNTWNLLNKSTYTATFTDGTVLTGTGTSFTYQGEYYNMSYSAEQSYENQWTAGNTYYINVSVMEQTVQVPVTITASPLQSLTFTPVSVVEGTCGYMATSWNPQTGNYDLEYYEYQPWELLNRSTYTATFTDGTVRTGNGTSFDYQGEYYSMSYSAEQSYENQWTPGNTYYMDVSVLGQTAQVPVTITPSPVVSLTVEPITVIEGKNWKNKVAYTITFDDGTSVSKSNGNGFTYDDDWYNLSYSDGSVDSDQWTAGNTYTATVYALGTAAQVSVTVTEHPVASITFDPIVVEENKDGYWSWYNNAQYFNYSWAGNLCYTVTFKDGTVKQGSLYNSVEYNGEEYGINSYSDNQSGDDPWLVDNTYTAQVYFEGKWYEVYVSVCSSTEDNGYEYMVQDGKAIITGCTTTGEILEIPETIDGYPVVAITSLGEALYYALELRIPDSVMTLSSGALNTGSRKIPLKKLVLGSGISSLDSYFFSSAWSLEHIEVSQDNPYLCSIDGVVYDKAVTKMIAYPPMKTDKHIVPDSVTNIDVIFDLYSIGDIQASTNIVFGEGITDYKIVDGIIYNADMTHLILCTGEATGSYIMPESVEYIHGYAFQNSNLTAVTISPNVTGITYTVFENCVSIEELTIPQSVQYLDIGGCDNLQKLHINDLAAWCNTSIGDNPLEDAKDLYLNGEKIVDLVIPDVVDCVYSNVFKGGSFESVTIPEGINYISYDAFANCENLKGVYITDLTDWCEISFDGEEANPLYWARDLYLNGELITDLQIPAGVETVGSYAFYNGSMTSVTIPDSVTRIGGYAFAGSAVESVSFAEGLQTIGERAFAGSALRSLELPDSIEVLEYGAFSNCAGLESVDLGSGLTSIGNYAFSNSGLTSITIPKQVTEIQYNAFADSALNQVQFDCESVSIWSSAFENCPLGDLDLTSSKITWTDWDTFAGIDATQIWLPETVTEISYRCYAFNTNLVSVTIPDTVTHIYKNAFEGDRNLSHVLYTGNQDQWDALDVQSPELNQATLHCEAVGDEVTTEQTCTSIRFFCTICDKWETVKKLNASHTFVDGVCTVCGQDGYWEYAVDEEAGEVTVTGYVGNDQDVTIPEEMEGLPVTAFAANTFAYNNQIVSVTIPGTVKQVYDEAFYNCQSLKSVTLENGVEEIGSYAFYNCRSLNDVVLADTVRIIGEYAFYDNVLGNFQLPTNVTTIGESAFYSCQMNALVIPEGVTEICYNTFGNCYELQELQLPSTLITIGENAFAGHALTQLEIPASVEAIGAGAFYRGYRNNLETVRFLGAKPSMEDAFEGKLTAFYDAELAGWEEYIATYEGDIAWYAAGAPEILVQPEDVTVESGSTATVSAKAYGQRLSYQWYYAPFGTDTFTAIGGNSFELSMVMDMNNPSVRAYCVISDVLGRTATTDTVTLKIDAIPTGIRIHRLPDVVEYDLRQALRTDGLEVMLVYSDLTETPLENYTISGYNANVGGQQVVTVSFGKYNAYFTVTVNEEKLNFAHKQEGIEISAPKDALDSDAVLVVESVRIEETLPSVPEIFEGNTSVSFDITLQKGQQEVQPSEKVKVSIPVPEHMQGKRCRVYHVAADGTIVDMMALLVGKYLEFYTDHFSLYSVVELPGYAVSGNIASNVQTAATVKLIRDGNVVQSVQTSTGAYRFDDVTDGSYTIEVCTDSGKVRSYAVTVAGADVYQNLSVVEYTVTFKDWDGREIASETYFEGSLVTAPADPVRANDRTYSYTFTGWDKQIVPCSADATYTATYRYSYLNDAGSITVGSTVVGVGDQFEIPVSVSDNLGIAGIKHTLTFDATALKLIGVEFQGEFAQGTPIVNEGKADEGLLTVLWFNNQDVDADGVMYTLTFEVLETATDKTSEVTIDFTEDGNANNAGENVIFDAVNGSVEVRTYWLGDLNGDKEYKMVDLLMLAQYVAEFELEFTDKQLLAADVNEDGDINIHDVILLNQWLLAADF